MKEIKPILGITHHLQHEDENGIPFTEHQINCLLDLTDEEFNNYLEAAQTIRSFRHDIQLFNIILWNLQDYFDTLYSYRESYIRKDEAYPNNRPPNLEVNRNLVNFLTSFTTYLTYTELRLKQRYGKNSQILKNFTKSTSKAFDEHFSYRFLYHLRNYTQHGGLPITEINFKSEPSKEDPTKPIHLFEVGISRDILLQTKFNWHSEVKKDLKNGPAYIDINNHLLIFLNCLSEINAKLMKAEFPTLSQPANYINNLCKRISYDDGDLNVFEFEITTDDQGTVINAIPLNIHFIELDLVNTIIEGRLKDLTSQITLYTL